MGSSEADLDEKRPLLQQQHSKLAAVAETTQLSSYDQLLPFIGDMGWWQFATIAILWPPSMAGGIIVLLSSFTALEPRAFRCALEVVLIATQLY